MEENKYRVLIDKVVVARSMDIKTATLLIKTLFDEYYNDYAMVISIEHDED